MLNVETGVWKELYPSAHQQFPARFGMTVALVKKDGKYYLAMQGGASQVDWQFGLCAPPRSPHVSGGKCAVEENMVIINLPDQHWTSN